MDAMYSEEDQNQVLDALKSEFEPKGIRVFPISAVSRQGVKELLWHINDLLKTVDQTPVVLKRSLKFSIRETEAFLIPLPELMTAPMW